MKRRLLVLGFLLSCLFVFSQDYFPKNDGVKTTNNNYIAFTNAKIYVTPTQIIESGTLLIQNGKVVNAGTSVSIPGNAEVINLEGKHIYPSFIDIYSGFGIAKPKRASGGGRSAQYGGSREGYYWNDHIMPEAHGVASFKFDSKKAGDLVKAGFGTVNTHLEDGIMRGTSMLVTLNDKDGDETRILDQDVANHLSFRKSVASRQSYPTSIMGGMALIRQVYHDSKWYAAGNSDTKDRSLEAVDKNKNLPQIIDAGSAANALRADKIANEFGMNYIIKGGGDEYANIGAIKRTNASFIIPLKFPAPYDVSDPYAASMVDLSQMKHWNHAPTNPGVLAKNGVQFALTTSELKSTKDFKSNLLKAIKHGLDETKALEALTTVPARLLGKSNMIGSLNKGAIANFLITSGDIFNKKTTVYENWVQGNKNVINDMNVKDIRGDYDLKIVGNTYNLKLSGELSKLKSEVKRDTVKMASKVTYKDGWLNLFYIPFDEKEERFVRLTAAIGDNDVLSGKGTLASGSLTDWSAIKKNGDSEDDTKGKDGKDGVDGKNGGKGGKGGKAGSRGNTDPVLVPLTYPNNAFGFKTKPKAEDLLFKNATVWTNEAEGIMESADVLVKNGRIAKVGKNLNDPSAKVIDATGKHLTSGVIDEHSHIAAASINEAGHNNSAEVTIEDVIEANDIGIYRNLSGGVTTIQILHGSANPIGGRSAIIKLKWGEDADGLLFKNAPKYIKFALGENVKQSNWNSFSRFPQTRMGVEQVFVDNFTRAREYEAKWKTYNALSKKAKARAKAPRYDIEMEAMVEILNKERFISCHSYVQSEINMLMKVAEQFDFRVQTFTHILEGYKVADKMKEHGVGGSTFSDWWAYKYEVNDAIPYNGAIMHSVGVVTAFNSDDAEMSRRLNQEAAKAIKYGGVSEEDAWKFVTLNPAKLLQIDDKVGSIKVGKHADLVLWSDHPMSIYAKAEKTIIEGVTYFDSARDEQLNKDILKERNMLINMMLKAKNSGMKTQPPKKKVKEDFHCDTVEQF